MWIMQMPSSIDAADAPLTPSAFFELFEEKLFNVSASLAAAQRAFSVDI